jgi:hypothetical protein
LTIFDWDDTLFCTTAFHPVSEKEVEMTSKKYKSELEEIDLLAVSSYLTLYIL